MQRLKFGILFLLLSLSTQAKLFTSQFVEFQLPPGWECAMEGSEWVCQSNNDNRKREAIIILAAKLRGKEDSIADYQKYLKQARAFRLPGGKKQVSEPKSTTVTQYNNHRWIDSLHLASEVPGFYTRYLATVKGDLGVLVTFSVSKDHYNSYKDVFDRVVSTLKVFAQMKKTDYVAKGKLKGAQVGDDFIEDSGDGISIGVNRQKRKSKDASGQEDMLIYILAAAVIGFIVFKMKSKKKGKKKGKKKKKS